MTNVVGQSGLQSSFGLGIKPDNSAGKRLYDPLKSFENLISKIPIRKIQVAAIGFLQEFIELGTGNS